jgi:hypothetical protein
VSATVALSRPPTWDWCLMRESLFVVRRTTMKIGVEVQ